MRVASAITISALLLFSADAQAQKGRLSDIFRAPTPAHPA